MTVALRRPGVRWTSLFASLALVASISFGTASLASAAKFTECQHPVVTGVEVSHLHHVSIATACRLALSLYRWENKDGHVRQLYVCAGKPPGKPRLKKHTFEGWALKISRSERFVMSRGASSFSVSGTDFPVICD